VYEQFFGLDRKPFDLLPNPEMIYMSRSHKRVMTYLEYGIESLTGFILLTGDIGSGKTTLIRNVINLHGQNLKIAKVFNTRVDSSELLSLINADFGLETKNKTRLQLIDDLNDFLIERFAQGGRSMIIIDECQNLSVETLEEVRLLSNLETNHEKLLQIVLVGQPELRTVLQNQELLQLRQRIGVNCHLHPLEPDELDKYIALRMEKAGNRNGATFFKGAQREIYAATRGVPRLVNILCDYLLLDAFVESTRFIDAARSQRVIADLDFQAAYWDAPEEKTPPPSQTGKDDVERTRKRLGRLLLGLESQLDSFEPFMGEMRAATRNMLGRLERIEAFIEHFQGETFDQEPLDLGENAMEIHPDGGRL